MSNVFGNINYTYRDVCTLGVTRRVAKRVSSVCPELDHSRSEDPDRCQPLRERASRMLLTGSDYAQCLTDMSELDVPHRSIRAKFELTILENVIPRSEAASFRTFVEGRRHALLIP